MMIGDLPFRKQEFYFKDLRLNMKCHTENPVSVWLHNLKKWNCFNPTDINYSKPSLTTNS